MLTILASGVLLGLSAGFTPGPLLALVLSQSLRHGIGEGVKVALSPLLTDLPIIVVSAFILTRLGGHASILGIISLCGAAVVGLLALETLRTSGVDSIGPAGAATGSLRKGALVNALSPHPYLFWLTVGGPLMLQGWSEGPATAVLFVLSFSLSLVSAKISLAVLAGKSRAYLRGRAYLVLMRLLGVLLLAFAGLLLRDGARLLWGGGPFFG